MITKNDIKSPQHATEVMCALLGYAKENGIPVLRMILRKDNQDIVAGVFVTTGEYETNALNITLLEIEED